MAAMSNADIQIILLQYEIGQFFGMTPITNTTKNNHRHLKTVCKILLFSVITCLAILTIWEKINVKQYYLSSFEVIINDISCGTEFFFILSCLFGNWNKYTENWRILLQTMNRIEEISNKFKYHSKMKIKLFWFRILISHIIVTLVILSEFVVDSKANDLDLIASRVSSKIIMYFKFFELIFIYNLTRMMTSRYNFVGKMIRVCLKEDSISFDNSGNTTLIMKIKNVHSLYQLLYMVIQQFNIIFGWQLFLLLACEVLSSISIADRILAEVKTSESSSFTVWTYFMLTISPMWNVLTVIVLVMSCSKVKKSGEEVITNCYRKSVLFENSSLKREMVLVGRLFEKLKPTFSAAGFFEISQPLLATIFTSVASYLIIMIQFSGP